jgi:hypothetical protein
MHLVCYIISLFSDILLFAHRTIMSVELIDYSSESLHPLEKMAKLQQARMSASTDA